LESDWKQKGQDEGQKGQKDFFAPFALFAFFASISALIAGRDFLVGYFPAFGLLMRSDTIATFKVS
jgi:hypothetical protein